MFDTFWKCCKIDYPQEICKIMKKYWFIIVIKLSSTLSTWFNVRDINFGMDYTFEFNWITEEGRIRFLQNSSVLGHEVISDMLQNTTVL